MYLFFQIIKNIYSGCQSKRGRALQQPGFCFCCLERYNLHIQMVVLPSPSRWFSCMLLAEKWQTNIHTDHAGKNAAVSWKWRYAHSKEGCWSKKNAGRLFSPSLSGKMCFKDYNRESRKIHVKYWTLKVTSPKTFKTTILFQIFWTLALALFYELYSNEITKIFCLRA